MFLSRCMQPVFLSHCNDVLGAASFFLAAGSLGYPGHPDGCGKVGATGRKSVKHYNSWLCLYVWVPGGPWGLVDMASPVRVMWIEWLTTSARLDLFRSDVAHYHSYRKPVTRGEHLLHLQTCELSCTGHTCYTRVVHATLGWYLSAAGASAT